AGLMILPQSVLLGATFPLMSAGVVRRAPRQSARVVALLYFANSLGAAGGVLAAGFWLVRAVGLPGTLATAAALNLVVAGVVLWIARRAPARSPEPESTGRRGVASATRHTSPPPPAPPPEVPPTDDAWLPRLMIAVGFGTAVASFVYEIAWIRMLSLVLGSATHSFELMLSAFILGLALGALWLRARVDRIVRPMRTLAVTQWAMGALALATLPLYSASFTWMVPLVGGLQTAPHGY